MSWGVGDIRKTKFAQSISNMASAAVRLKEAATSPTDFLKMPRYISGARVYLMVGGDLLGIATSVSWTVGNTVDANVTIDSNIPFEIIPNTFSIKMQISQLVDPDDSPESQGLWSTMTSNPHQPNIEVSVYDKIGTNLVNIRGMPDRITQNIQAGQLMTRNVSITGVMFTHNVSQGFEPYKESEFMSKLKNAKNSVSKNTLGLL